MEQIPYKSIHYQAIVQTIHVQCFLSLYHLRWKSKLINNKILNYVHNGETEPARNEIRAWKGFNILLNIYPVTSKFTILRTKLQWTTTGHEVHTIISLQHQAVYLFLEKLWVFDPCSSPIRFHARCHHQVTATNLLCSLFMHSHLPSPYFFLLL